jgi:hypothetical protein
LQQNTPARYAVVDRLRYWHQADDRVAVLKTHQAAMILWNSGLLAAGYDDLSFPDP